VVFVFVEEKTPGSGNGIVTALAGAVGFLLTDSFHGDSWGVHKVIFDNDPNHRFSVTCDYKSRVFRKTFRGRIGRRG
jgi:hypothetical protein